MTYTAHITNMPLKELLDPQGKAVMGGLGNLGLDAIKDVRMITGKMQFLLPLSAVLLRTSSQCATGYYLCVRLQ